MSNEFFKVKEIEVFSACMKKLSVNPKELNSEEKDYILSVAVLLMKKYSLDKRYISYAELAYFIVLNYSLTFSDYEPLYDISISLGLYPVSYAITKNKLLEFETIENSLIEFRIEKRFKNNNIIETYEQKKMLERLLEPNINEKCFIAPTSFGKSHLILTHIKQFFDPNKRYGIIVPTKALLMQVYRDVKSMNLKTHIILHDEMYQEDDIGFIAVMTQERAFRLTNKHNIYFDFMYIDEAHQLLEKDARSILLSRLIKLNQLHNTSCKMLFFSPLISDSTNLKLLDNQNISERRIKFNLKEPKIFEYRMDNKKLVYNRFLNEFFEIATSATNIFEYMQENSGKKNFIYLYTPKKIQKFANELIAKKPSITDSPAINEIIDNLNKYVHSDFYLTDCIKRGIIYIHGKLPDNVRDYLLTKFSKIPELSTVIANKVILEGINLPIDTLFILNCENLKQKDLINLIGRVNRLNEIFGKETNFKKLQPPIHFVNSAEYNRRNGKLCNKIKLLKKTTFVDEIENPLLRKFEESKIKSEKEINIIKNIVKEDTLFFSEKSKAQDILKKKLIELGLNSVYSDIDKVSEYLYERFSHTDFLNISENNGFLHVMDRLKQLFINGLENYIIDEEVKRLKNTAAITYYKMFLDNRKLSLNEKISREVNYFKKRIENGEAYLYMGYSFGEISFPDESRGDNKVYVNLATKNNKELINLAIIKQKQEDDFVSFKLFMFFQLMLDYEQLSESEYEQIIYGSTNKRDIQLVKQGMPINLVERLKNDNQLDNIFFDENKNIQCKPAFKEYKDSLDDFLKFEIDRVL